MRVLSLCCGAGLLDRAFMDEGFEVVAGCEIDEGQRELYKQLCGSTPLCYDIADLPQLIKWQDFDGVIGGPPCQSHTKLKSLHKPKYDSKTNQVQAVLDVLDVQFFLFENVAPLIGLRYANYVSKNAMNYYQPHQSRERIFSYYPSSLPQPRPVFRKTADELMAYPAVSGNMYSLHRACELQGYPQFKELKATGTKKMIGIVNAVPYPLARLWAQCCKDILAFKG